MSLPDVAGITGVMLIVGTYFLLQSGKLRSENLSYSLLNAAGAGMIIYSLIFDFNLSAFIIEAFWVAISLYGVFRFLKSKKK